MTLPSPPDWSRSPELLCLRSSCGLLVCSSSHMKKTVRGRRKDSGAGPLESIFSDILRTAWPMTTILETPRLLFRDFEASDAEAAFEIYGDAVVMEFIG